MDIFVPIPGFLKYAITITGKVVNLKNGRALKARQISVLEHSQYRLRNNESTGYVSMLTHRLVYIAFTGQNIHSTQLVLHKDGNATNNHFDNLYLGNYRQNNQDSVRHGKRLQTRKLSDQDVVEIIADSRPNLQISKAYKVSSAYIDSLKHGRKCHRLTKYERCHLA
jgi:hypothetical protein